MDWASAGLIACGLLAVILWCILPLIAVLRASPRSLDEHKRRLDERRGKQ